MLINFSFQLQIITILSIQEIDFDVQTDVLGKERINLKTSTEKIVALCKPYVDQLTDTKLLAKSLVKFLDQANEYFYELYQCVVEILQEINELPTEMEWWSHILVFLQHKMVTKRCNRIGQEETDRWLKTQADFGMLPKIAKYRFPIRMLVMGPLKNILGELIVA